MEQYIPKSAVLAEIERRKKIVEKRLYINNSYSEEGNAAWERDKALYDAYNSLLSFLNTLEVKEVQEEPVSEELEEAATKYAQDKYMPVQTSQAFKAGAKWQKENLCKSADGEDLPELERGVIVLTQPYPLEGNEYAVSFAHRPNKYAKVWNSDLGEEQVVEIKRYDKGGWNIPNVKWWLDCSLPNLKED